jgi:DNA repair exonuclease SbcCD ATPase subunit
MNDELLVTKLRYQGKQYQTQIRGGNETTHYLIEAADRIEALLDEVRELKAQGEQECCPFCHGTGGHWEGCKAPIAAPAKADARIKELEAEVVRFRHIIKDLEKVRPNIDRENARVHALDENYAASLKQWQDKLHKAEEVITALEKAQGEQDSELINERNELYDRIIELKEDVSRLIKALTEVNRHCWFGEYNPAYVNRITQETLKIVNLGGQHSDVAADKVMVPRELKFSNEDWGRIVNGLILEIERSKKRKAVNSESCSDLNVLSCGNIIRCINKAIILTKGE